MAQYRVHLGGGSMPCQIELLSPPKKGDSIRVPSSVSEDGKDTVLMVMRKIKSVKSERAPDSQDEAPIFENHIYLESL